MLKAKSPASALKPGGITPVGLNYSRATGSTQLISPTPVPPKPTPVHTHIDVAVPQGGDNVLWLARSHELPPDKMNGWVVSWILESFLKEDMVASATEKSTFKERLEANGLASLLDTTVGPRKKCAMIKES